MSDLINFATWYALLKDCDFDSGVINRRSAAFYRATTMQNGYTPTNIDEVINMDYSNVSVETGDVIGTTPIISACSALVRDMMGLNYLDPMKIKDYPVIVGNIDIDHDNLLEIMTEIRRVSRFMCSQGYVIDNDTFTFTGNEYDPHNLCLWVVRASFIDLVCELDDEWDKFKTLM